MPGNTQRRRSTGAHRHTHAVAQTQVHPEKVIRLKCVISVLLTQSATITRMSWAFGGAWPGGGADTIFESVFGPLSTPLSEVTSPGAAVAGRDPFSIATPGVSFSVIVSRGCDGSETVFVELSGSAAGLSWSDIYRWSSLERLCTRTEYK